MFPEMGGKKKGLWMFHHDSAPAHLELSTRELLMKFNSSIIPHLPNSPDCAATPTNIFLFLKPSKRKWKPLQKVQRRNRIAFWKTAKCISGHWNHWDQSCNYSKRHKHSSFVIKKSQNL
jgi:hypothetical protein